MTGSGYQNFYSYKKVFKANFLIGICLVFSFGFSCTFDNRSIQDDGQKSEPNAAKLIQFANSHRIQFFENQ